MNLIYNWNMDKDIKVVTF
ncbi:hypothetical protein AAY473_009354 [Plecturocebus cupreus]